MKYSLATLALFASATSMMWADTLTDSETSSATTDFAKQYNPIHTEAISLGVTPDARGGAMGDVGAATEPDENSQYWNPAKYAFAYSRGGIAVNYTPWLRKIVSDINLAYVSGYWKFGYYDNQAISASLRYFSLGEVTVISLAAVVCRQAMRRVRVRKKYFFIIWLIVCCKDTTLILYNLIILSKEKEKSSKTLHRRHSFTGL